jgi:site-specific recombinase XerD
MAEDLSLDDAMALFLDALLVEGRSAHTVRSYKGYLRSLMEFLGDMALGGIRATDVRNYLKDARQRRAKHVNNPHRPVVEEPLSRETIRSYYRHIRAFFAWCHREELINENPCERVRMPPPTDHPPKVIASENFRKLVLAAGTGGQMPERDLAILLVLGDTGVRAGGIVGLTLDRLDLGKVLIEVIEKGEGRGWFRSRQLWSRRLKRGWQ